MLRSLHMGEHDRISKVSSRKLLEQIRHSSMRALIPVPRGSLYLLTMFPDKVKDRSALLNATPFLLLEGMPQFGSVCSLS